MTARAITEIEVKRAVKGALAAAPKGARVLGYRARIASGGIEVHVTLAPESVQGGAEGVNVEAFKSELAQRHVARRP